VLKDEADRKKVTNLIKATDFYLDKLDGAYTT